jgi:preprotein translocase subunit SecD
VADRDPQQKQSKKASSCGLFRYGAVTAIFLLVTADIAAGEPLAIEFDSVQTAYDQRTGEPVITFKMSPASQKLFAQLTLKNVGHKLAMRVDGQTLSEPVIREPILGGFGQISGHFTDQQARDIAGRLSSGRSKLELDIVD